MAIEHVSLLQAQQDNDLPTSVNEKHVELQPEVKVQIWADLQRSAVYYFRDSAV